MTKPRVLLPWWCGTNCHHETKEAVEKVGAEGVIVPLDMMDRPKLYEADLIVFSGGFSEGDYFGSGRVAAIDLAARLRSEMIEVLARRIPMLGICNGFQILTAAGLIPGRRLGEPTAALDFNRSSRFEHWYRRKLILHEPKGVNCVWTVGLEGMEVYWPTAHGEGRWVQIPGSKPPNVIATYGTPDGTTEYPDSPSGSPMAGVCDESGLTAGFMPHPERRIDPLRGGIDGLVIFENGVNAVR